MQAPVQKKQKTVMPKGRRNAYRKDCKSRPEVYRAGMERFRSCVFTVKHGAMAAGPETVMRGLSVMFDAVIRNQCDFVCGDGNKATSTITRYQGEADFVNSMLNTVARASVGAFNEGKSQT